MTDPIWQSACLDCPPELRNYDSQRCKNCEKRIQRLREIGGLSDPPPMKSVKGETMVKNIPEIKNMDKVIEAARTVCKTYKVNYDRELMTKNKDKKVTQARRHVIIILSRKPYGLSNRQVGKYLSLSQQYISHVINHHKYIISSQSSEINMAVGKQESRRIVIDFNGQEDLLGIVELLAKKELRPVNLQLLHMVKSQADLLYEEYKLDKDEF